LKGGEVKDSLSEEEREKCESLVNNYIDDKDPNKTLMLNDRLMITECFALIKKKFNSGAGMNRTGDIKMQQAKNNAAVGPENEGNPQRERGLQEEVLK
jgi:hypothetical protein